MAKNFVMITQRPQLVRIFEKYGYAFLLEQFEPILKSLDYPPAIRALRLLRRQMSLDDYLDEAY